MSIICEKTNKEIIEMKDEELLKIGEWLNSQGYMLNLKDDFWMEDWISSCTKVRDIAEMLHDYASLKVAEATKEMYPKEFVEWKDNNLIRKLGGWVFNYDNVLMQEARWKTLDELFDYWKQNIRENA